MKEYRLGDIATIYNGSTPSTKNNEYWDGDIVWITPKDLSDQNRKYIDRGERTITGEGLSKISSVLLPKGTLLLSSRAPIGLLSIANTELVTNQGFKNIVTDSSVLFNEYLYYYLKINVEYLNKLGTGTTFKELSKTTLENINIRIPSVPVQKTVASTLSALDSKIEINNQINQQLEEMAKTTYDYWFVQFDFPNEEGKPYKSSGGKMVYNKQLRREIPEGWEVKTIEDYCPSTGGFAFKSSWWTDYGVKVVKIKNIQEDNTIDINDLDKVDISDKNVDERFMATPGDVLIAMTGATIGKYGVVPISDTPIYINQRVGHFKLADESLSKLPFLINSMHQEYFRESIFAYAGGAAQPNISNEQINKIPLIYPKDKVVDDYNALLLSSYKTILNNQYENQQLASLRDWLLPMLMNGQVEVGE